MNLLVIDSTAEDMVIAACNDEKIAVRISKEGNKRHNSLILPLIVEVLEELQLDKKDLNAIGCVVGAGSFTGIRIGIATAQALSTALNIPTISITAFEDMAYDELGNFITAIDCRHNNYYCAEFNGSWKNIVELKSYSKDELSTKTIKVIYKESSTNGKNLIYILQY